jgi:hypothetical protein
MVAGREGFYGHFTVTIDVIYLRLVMDFSLTSQAGGSSRVRIMSNTHGRLVRWLLLLLYLKL